MSTTFRQVLLFDYAKFAAIIAFLSPLLRNSFFGYLAELEPHWGHQAAITGCKPQLIERVLPHSFLLHVFYALISGSDIKRHPSQQ